MFKRKKRKNQTVNTTQPESLSFKNEFQREAVTRRIREKALAENIRTVMILTEIDNERTALLSGISSGMRVSASISYSFDDKTKTVTSWKMT
jgi:hypothetical protein